MSVNPRQVVSVNPRDEPLLVNDADVDSPAMSSRAHEQLGRQTDKKSIAVALCTVIISIPALIVSTGARHATHIITLFINLVIIGGLCIYVTYKARHRDPYPYSKWQKWGPAILVWISLPFIMADPLRHVLNDNNWWQSCERACFEKWPSRCDWTSEQYKCTVVCGEDFTPPYNDAQCEKRSDGTYPHVSCTCVPDKEERMRHLSTVGIVFTICFTYFGFALFLWGNLWNANIVDKCKDMRHKYRVLRGLSDSDY